ncbi:hypothetical protein FCR2A7T_27170 [Flavobacterium cauense R2A-7]|uniref:Uncharacterized protein n=1 Tax=Flavobacterium cauense R2A-7 TaxID=1341154 RepID=V6RXS4_9FLAO|nr:hypothetical protein [Flavobacterium cauense]ESU19291.1 hypothetical protein FCR2A7T_27170 [Flavobacterium cauense R2A-7]KGO82092.1 hypothetical protein Q762_05180 [Flavobacterium cauense R2A-7]TWI15039.1 hypothetical protein IP98_00021 [Flavobacterium cauense R2A-7]
MFLKLLKDFSIKKLVKKSLVNYKPVVTEDKIQTVGLLIDESYFTQKEALISEITKNGIDRNALEILIYRDKIKKKDTFENPFFSRDSISFGAEFQKQDITDFINKPFDMLISYYDVEKPPLVLVTLQSKAKFKVGFSTVEKRLNAFMITTVAEKHSEFVTELFKYLKILKKI